MVQAGRLDKLARIEEPHFASDSLGVTNSYKTVIENIWVGLEPTTGTEDETTPQLYGLVTHRIRAHYVPGIKPTMRVVAGGRLFEIQHVMNHEERNRELVMLCIERTD